MVRPASFDSNGMKKGAWSEEEDNKLRAYVMRYGHWNWRLLPKYAGLARCGKSCRLRWVNYLKPGVKRGNFTKQEGELIAKLHKEHGNKWSAIAAQLPGRTDNEIKNHWHTNIKKRHRNNRQNYNPTSKHVEVNPSTDESCKNEVLEGVHVKPYENNSCKINQTDSPSSLEINTPKEIDQNPEISFDTIMSLESITEVSQPLMDLSWFNSSSPFAIDSTYHSFESDYLPHLQDKEFFNSWSDQFSSPGSSSNGVAVLDLFSEDDQSIISSDSVAQTIYGSFWSELLALTNDPYINQVQEHILTQGMGELYDPFLPSLDHGITLFESWK